jgi:hypothetical protein
MGLHVRWSSPSERTWTTPENRKISIRCRSAYQPTFPTNDFARYHSQSYVRIACGSRIVVGKRIEYVRPSLPKRHLPQRHAEARKARAVPLQLRAPGLCLRSACGDLAWTQPLPWVCARDPFLSPARIALRSRPARPLGSQRADSTFGGTRQASCRDESQGAV